MGIQLSKLVPDNLAKGKQPVNNSLLNFVARKRNVVNEEEHVRNSVPIEQEIPVVQESNDVEKEIPTFELPSASQIDTDVFNQLPDELKNDIIQEYQRKGLKLNGLFDAQIVVDTEPVNNHLPGPSHAAPTNVTSPKRSIKPVSYDGIEGVTDIDASYWSALPDDIKSEIERDIQIRKAESTSPTKIWKDIFKGKQSPVKANAKLGKRKGKALEPIKVNVRQISSSKKARKI